MYLRRIFSLGKTTKKGTLATLLYQGPKATAEDVTAMFFVECKRKKLMPLGDPLISIQPSLLTRSRLTHTACGYVSFKEL